MTLTAPCRHAARPLAAAVVCTLGLGAACAQNRPVTNYLYDANGNLTGMTTGLGQATNQTYDALGRLRSLTQPAPAAGAARPVVQIVPDGQDQTTRVVDPRNLATTYGVDGLGRVAQQVSSDTGTSTATYDAAGNVLTRTDARGRTTTYTYDRLQRPTLIRYADRTQTVLSYDQGANGIGRLTGLADPGGVATAWSYDINGRVLSRRQTVGTRTHTVAYSYAAGRGQLTSITYPSGRVVGFSYDGNGLLNTVRVDGQPVASSLTWHPHGELKRMTLGNGLVWTSTLDQDGRMVSYTLGGETYTLTWDAANRVTAITHPTDAFWSRSYAYDGLDRVTGFTSSPRRQTFAYDASGNLTARRDALNANALATATYRIDAASNRMTGIDSLGVIYTLDAAGNRTQDNRFTYSYDARGRLVRVVSNTGATTTYLLNALGQRVRKAGAAVPGGMRHFVYDEQGRLLGEYDNLGRAQSEHVWLNERPVAVLVYTYSGTATTPATTTVGYVEADHLGSPQMITDAQRRQRWRWHPAPYGDTLANENPAGVGVFQYHLRFAGQYFDVETNLHYNWHRDYEPTAGRYVQSDPIGLEGGINTYAYVGGNPLSRTDPLGLWSVTFGGYAGVGGEVTFGRDPNTCQGFMSFKFGWGVGGGAKWDPRGGRPGADASSPARANGITLGLFADADFNFGPLQTSLQNSLGRDVPFWRSSSLYGDFMKPNVSFGDSWGIKAGVAAGGEISIYTANPSAQQCGCK